jgi:putative ABC transport system permease protein
MAMFTWVQIGLRNLYRNRRRSAFTVGAIAFGFAAINLFGGFTAYVFTGLEEGHIYAFGNGHLAVARTGNLSEGSGNQADTLLTDEEIRKVESIARTDSRILLVAPQLLFSGLLSNGQDSTIFIGMGRNPSQTRTIASHARGTVAQLKPYDGTPLDDAIPTHIGLSAGLAKRLGIERGGDVIAMAPTVNGQMNALDARVCQTFDAREEALADKVALTPLSFARELCDTTGANRLNILLTDTRHTETVRDSLARQLRDTGLNLEVISWQNLSLSYFKIRDMFQVIFSFLFTIVLIIVILSVVNTISMAVMERTREIGTLRALGLKQRGTIALFAIESALLALLGCAAGLLLTFLGWGGIRLLEPTWIPPTFTRRIPLEVYLVPEYQLLSLVFLVGLCVLAAVLPSRRAARMSIVDSLGHV